MHRAVVYFNPRSFLVESFYSFFKTASACSAASSLQSISLKGENQAGEMHVLTLQGILGIVVIT